MGWYVGYVVGHGNPSSCVLFVCCGGCCCLVVLVVVGVVGVVEVWEIDSCWSGVWDGGVLILVGRGKGERRRVVWGEDEDILQKMNLFACVDFKFFLCKRESSRNFSKQKLTIFDQTHQLIPRPPMTTRVLALKRPIHLYQLHRFIPRPISARYATTIAVQCHYVHKLALIIIIITPASKPIPTPF